MSSDGKLHGQGDDVDKACRDAWGKRQHGDPQEYIVDEIRVYGNNPITHYTVILRPA